MKSDVLTVDSSKKPDILNYKDTLIEYQDTLKYSINKING